MSHELPNLPFAADALQPHVSAETLSFHHGKHHAAYVAKLNAAIGGTPYANLSLQDTIARAREQGDGGIFNNAAQHFNHGFYWNSLTPGGSEASSALQQKLVEAFGSVEGFKEQFTAKAGGHFGSGWAWLVADANNNLSIVDTHDAESPVGTGAKPLLTCDVWEHAYYIDYRNARPDYLKAFWELVNWDFIEQNLG